MSTAFHNKNYQFRSSILLLIGHWCNSNQQIWEVFGYRPIMLGISPFIWRCKRVRYTGYGSGLESLLIYLSLILGVSSFKEDGIVFHVTWMRAENVAVSIVDSVECDEIKERRAYHMSPITRVISEWTVYIFRELNIHQKSRRRGKQFSLGHRKEEITWLELIAFRDLAPPNWDFLGGTVWLDC